MHSLLTGVPESHGGHAGSTSDTAASTSITSHEEHPAATTATVAMDSTHAPAGGGGEHEPKDTMGDCGGLVAMCLALLVSFAGLLMARAKATDRVLWQLPPAALVRIGTVRRALETLSPLQRTAILRC